jgi:hypothetical protein
VSGLTNSCGVCCVNGRQDNRPERDAELPVYRTGRPDRAGRRRRCRRRGRGPTHRVVWLAGAELPRRRGHRPCPARRTWPARQGRHHRGQRRRDHATMGLIKAVDRVEPGRGSRFHSLAVPRSPHRRSSVSYAGMSRTTDGHRECRDRLKNLHIASGARKPSYPDAPDPARSLDRLG